MVYTGQFPETEGKQSTEKWKGDLEVKMEICSTRGIYNRVEHVLTLQIPLI